MSFAIAILFLCIGALSARCQEFGVVHIYRDPTLYGSAIVPRVFADGVALVDVGHGRHYAGQFPPGLHVFHVDDKRSGVQINVEPGKAYYLRVEIIPGFWSGQGRLTMVLPEQGSYEIRTLLNVERPSIRNLDVPLLPHRSAAMVQEDLIAVAQALLLAGRFPKKIPRVIGESIKNPRLIDPWGTPYLYRLTDDGKGFVMASAGSDRTFDESSWPVLGLQDDMASDFVVIGSRKKADVVRRWKTE